MTSSPRQYRYFDFVMAAFVTVLICSNLIGPAKIAQVDLPVVGLLTFGAGALFFPISYVFGDVLTEVYGYARAQGDLGGIRRPRVRLRHGHGGGRAAAGVVLEKPGRLRDRVRLGLAHRPCLDDRLLLR